jgi:ribosome-associated protein
MIKISQKIEIPKHEVKIKGTLAQGAGGQNINKVSTAAHLRFDINRSSLPFFYKDHLNKLKNSKITKEKIIIIKSQKFRHFEKNKDDAIKQLTELIHSVSKIEKKRRNTKPTLNSQKRRLSKKTKHSSQKKLRSKVKIID